MYLYFYQLTLPLLDIGLSHGKPQTEPSVLFFEPLILSNTIELEDKSLQLEVVILISWKSPNELIFRVSVKDKIRNEVILIYFWYFNFILILILFGLIVISVFEHEHDFNLSVECMGKYAHELYSSKIFLCRNTYIIVVI